MNRPAVCHILAIGTVLGLAALAGRWFAHWLPLLDGLP